MANTKDFERAALVHLDVVFRAAVALCRDRNRAEDLTQTTFLKALQRFKSFRQGTNCRAWLMRILHNTWIDQLRHQKVAGPSVPVDEQLMPGPQRQEDVRWTDAKDMLENFGDAQVIDALGELPDEQRLALFLVDVEGFSQEEVAKITHTAVGTVKSRTSRGRKTLRERLTRHAIDLGFLERSK